MMVLVLKVTASSPLVGLFIIHQSLAYLLMGKTGSHNPIKKDLNYEW